MLDLLVPQRIAMPGRGARLPIVRLAERQGAGPPQKTEEKQMARQLRIAGLQMLIPPDVSENEANISVGLRRAAKDEADRLLTPDRSLSGYTREFAILRVRRRGARPE